VCEKERSIHELSLKDGILHTSSVPSQSANERRDQGFNRPRNSVAIFLYLLFDMTSAAQLKPAGAKTRITDQPARVWVLS
jgi:hypothetical protein